MGMLTDDQRAQMLHAIGGKLHGGHRNHYVSGYPSDVWEPLVSDGMATRRDREAFGGTCYHVTATGLGRLRAEMPSDGRKAWEVKIDGSDPVVSKGKTRGSARMTVVLEYAHTCDFDVGDVLSRVRWCRRAPWADARGHHGRDELLTIEESRPPC